jgi:hypothetical protein
MEIDGWNSAPGPVHGGKLRNPEVNDLGQGIILCQ